MDRRLEVFGVVNGADPGNQTQCECRTGAVAADHYLLPGRGIAVSRVSVDESGETTFAINAPAHVTHTGAAERVTAPDAKRRIFDFWMIKTVHQEISLNC